jgi:hypothetical protein
MFPNFHKLTVLTPRLFFQNENHKIFIGLYIISLFLSLFGHQVSPRVSISLCKPPLDLWPWGKNWTWCGGQPNPSCHLASPVKVGETWKISLNFTCEKWRIGEFYHKRGLHMI